MFVKGSKILIKLDLGRRTNSFLALGECLKALPLAERDDLFRRANYFNPWFTPDNVDLAWQGLLRYLDEEKLKSWLSHYDLSAIRPCNVGVVMAGNIPLVGIHDMICTLICGHRLIAKLSSQDEVLIKFIAQKLIEIDPAFNTSISFVERLTGIDAVIATGSDNSSRYFEYYFGKYPHIIRKNRTSVAVLQGTETPAEHVALSHDIFSYFGMGCRNVSKIYLPHDMDIRDLFSHWQDYSHLSDHNKYANNYHYQRSILLMTQQSFFDNGFAVFMESKKLVSPVSMVYYDSYANIASLQSELDLLEDKIQCIVAQDGFLEGTNEIGTAQKPDVMDYADHVDTITFLTQL